MPTKLDEAAMKLDEASEAFFFEKFGQIEPSPSETVAHLKQIGSLSRKLLDALGVKHADILRGSGRSPDPIGRHFDYGKCSAIYFELAKQAHGNSNLKIAISSVVDLMRWSDAGAHQVGTLIRSHNKSRHEPDEALNGFLYRTIEVWRMLGLDFKVSRNGPAFLFSRQCVDHLWAGVAERDKSNKKLEIQLSDEGLYKRLLTQRRNRAKSDQDFGLK